ncbi:hypothetical protein O4H61_01860 [Roseovarius aestuarii]|nr:hypothetical protein [Roseovarius aestuarii]
MIRPHTTPDGGSPYIHLRMGGDAAVMRGQAQWDSAPELEHRVGRLEARWHWDGVQLVGDVDRFGFFNLYVYEKDGEVAVSPSLLELVAQGADTTPDTRALAVFHRLGIFINDDTPLKYVRTLPPSGRVVWHNGRTHITGGVDVPRAQTISREGAVTGMTELFRQAMQRILSAWDGPMTLPLSGGYDSRHTLLEMLHQGRQPDRCVTFHHNGAALNTEALAARAVASRAGLRHDILGYARPRLADALRSTVMTSLCADEHAQMMPLHDYMLNRPGAAFDGIAGDILTNPDNDAETFYRLAEKGDFISIARGLITGHSRVISQDHWQRGAGALYSPGHDDEVLDYVGRALEKYADAPDPYQVFWMYHRTRREINFVPQSILSPSQTVFCPYLDDDFASFCLSLPYSVTKDQKLHHDCMAQAYPDYADIPFAHELSAPRAKKGSLMHKLRSAADVMRITDALGPAARAHRRVFLSKPKQLRRSADTAYRLHALCLEGLDAGRARHLLNLAKQLEDSRPKRLISDAI